MTFSAIKVAKLHEIDGNRQILHFCAQNLPWTLIKTKKQSCCALAIYFDTDFQLKFQGVLGNL
jgi:hypothetical protein